LISSVSLFNGPRKPKIFRRRLDRTLLVDAGQQMVTGHMTRLSGTHYTRLDPGQTI